MEPHCKVYKDQCAFCFACPERNDGLFVCVFHKYSFCEEHMKIHQKTGPCKKILQYIRHKRPLDLEKISSACENPPTDHKVEAPVPKITKLAIGLKGGVSLDNKKFETVEEWYFFDDFPNKSTKVSIECRDASAMENLLPEVRQVLVAESAYRLRELEALAGTWDGSALIRTKHADLKQLPYNGPVLNNPESWICQREGCDKTQNLWLNLTDGKLLCGRQYADGSGGNNHAVEYYRTTGFPLAVNLGTVTPDGADVFSYDEDEMILDSNLDKHLRHYGIDMLSMQKLEKTMLEKELDLNTTWEYASIQEDGKKLTPAYGVGFLGLHNLGNSCYVNSLAQALAQIPSTVHKMYDLQKNGFFGNVPKNANPYENFKVQVAKLFGAFTRPEYSLDPEKAEKIGEFELPENGIRPYDFRYVVGRGHREFATKKQQDVEEFAHHLSNLCRLNFEPEIDPFLSVDHLVYVKSSDGHSAYHKVNRHSHTSSNKPVKLNYALEVDEILDLNFLRAQPCEIEPKDAAQIEMCGNSGVSSVEVSVNCVPKSVASPSFPTLSDTTKNKLLSMGYSGAAIKKAVDHTKSDSLENLVNWLLEKSDDPALSEINVPINADVDPSALSTLLEYGFEESKCRFALSACNNSVDASVSLIFEPDFEKRFACQAPPPTYERPIENERLLNSSQDVQRLVHALQKQDGGGVYTLSGIISHIGTSTDTGHYVYHGKKDNGRWVIYNDEKVAWSENPPIENGYVYMFKRL